MGGRSGQSIARVASAEAKPPDSLAVVAVLGARGLSEGFERSLGSEVRLRGVTGDVSIVFGYDSGMEGGAVSWVPSKTIRGGYEIDPTIKVFAEGMSNRQITEIVRHEATHIKQAQDGRFYAKQGFFYWEGKKYLSVGTYSKYLKGMRSGDPDVRKKAYSKYRSLPWEVEAHAAGDPFK